MKAINFRKWIDENRHLLKPPVGNQQIWLDREFMITVVGGPNSRTDFHINEGEEFFYQVEGDINLRMIQDGKPVDFPIREGEIFLLPPHVPHSPQRGAGTVGLVIERRRLPHEIDSFLWICSQCHHPLWKKSLHLEDIVKDLPVVFEEYYSDPAHQTCSRCGKRHEGRKSK
jgi:3-hydroxyanthranilate 3,4-dioxygenase